MENSTSTRTIIHALEVRKCSSYSKFVTKISLVLDWQSSVAVDKVFDNEDRCLIAYTVSD